MRGWTVLGTNAEGKQVHCTNVLAENPETALVEATKIHNEYCASHTLENSSVVPYNEYWLSECVS